MYAFFSIVLLFGFSKKYNLVAVAFAFFQLKFGITGGSLIGIFRAHHFFAG